MTRRNSTSSRNDNRKQLYSFEDIDEGQRVVYRGDVGYVADKGEDVSDAAAEASHLLIRFINQNRAPQKVHERSVNRYIRKQKTMWIDWDGIGIPARKGEN